jgi:hypothetical protein
VQIGGRGYGGSPQQEYRKSQHSPRRDGHLVYDAESIDGERGALIMTEDYQRPIGAHRQTQQDLYPLAPHEPDLTAPAPPEPAPRPRNRWPLIIGAVGVSPAANGRERM